MNTKFNKLIPSPEARLKFKKQCLKPKNILFENDSVQLGCKIVPFYDFYSSKHYLQIQIFIGNKTNKKIHNFSLSFKGTPNLQMHIEQKQRQIPENTQYKQRLMVECLQLDSQILLLLDYKSQSLTALSIPIPITMFSFCFLQPQSVSTLPLTASYSQLLDLLSARFQYIQQTEITVSGALFRKGLMQEIGKYFSAFTQHIDNMYVGQFNLDGILKQYVMVLLVKDETRVKVTLAANLYRYFQVVFGSLGFLLGA